MDAGAQLEVENGQGKTALDLTTNAGVAEVLIRGGADACHGNMKWRDLARRCRAPLVELFAAARSANLSDDVVRTIGRMALDDHR
jgi:hypothetical protein